MGRSDHKGNKETFGDDGYVHYFDCSNGSWVNTYVKMCQIICFKHGHQLHVNHTSSMLVFKNVLSNIHLKTQQKNT